MSQATMNDSAFGLTRAEVARLRGSAVRVTDLLKAMANPSRLMILCQLAEGEKSVGEMETVIGLSQSGLSQHLAVLRRKGIVSTRREAQSIFYSLASKEVEEIMAALYRVFCAKVARKRAPRLQD
ncbi:MAG TPA: metalloregulator ArsR/SmtB family transcription factor [Burkholderiales bacterium]|nr:metalloregulator ArsR/SmtB family transcription factor [Burkholderiales bacterium]